MHTVRTHTRKGANGKQVQVQHHARTSKGAASKPPGKPRKKRKPRKSLARRGWGNLKSAWKMHRRKRDAACAAYLALAGIQIGAYVGLQGLALTCTTVAVVATATAITAGFVANMGRR